jgi:hypothetical protein
MIQPDLKSMTIEQLLARFAEIGVSQDGALLEDEIGKFNHLFDGLMAVEAELKARTGDQRRALMRLYDHPNMQVRLNAAKATLAVSPQAARRTVEAIASSRHFPQAGDAGMSLANLDRGIFKPT